MIQNALMIFPSGLLAIFPDGTDIIVIISLILGPSLLVFFTAQYMFKQHILSNIALVKTEILKSNVQTLTPLKLQAYERLTLFLERTSIPSLIKSHAHAEQTARGFAAAATMAINDEYAYNVSQQIYVSNQMWTLLKAIKEQSLQMINNVNNSLPPNATAADISQKLIELLQSMESQPQDRGIDFMKNEIALTLGQ